MFFLYAPLLVLIAFSFNDSKRNIVWRGFTFKYYGKVLENDGLMAALGNSLTIAALATAFSIVLGTLAAVMLWRFRFPFKAGVEGTMALPIVVPEICMGVAMLVFFAKLDWPTDMPWPLNLSAITIAHITFCFPFVAMVVRARLAGFNKEQEEAAKDLGATEWQAFRDVLLPHMKPGIIAGCLLVFITSIGYYVTPALLGGPSDQMLSYYVAQYTNVEVNWGMACALGAILFWRSAMAFYCLAEIQQSGRLAIGFRLLV